MKEQFELQLPDLLSFVKVSCHENLHDTLNELRDDSTNFFRSAQTYEGLPEQLPHFLLHFIQTIQMHLAHEENTLFPSIAAGKAMSQASSIPHLVDDHEQMKLDLLTIRQMTQNYELPDHLNIKIIHFYKKLREMDRIILNHIQIEDHILFPMLLKSS
jgi:iron-sulfur cluster repair protein YtfE (RIC family)